MKVWALCKVDAESANRMDVPHVIISIHSPGRPQARPVANDKTLGTMFLCFHDLDRQPSPGGSFEKAFGPPRIFTLEDAARVIGFLDTWKPEGVICQCEAGRSRSAGLAAAIAKYHNNDDSEFFQTRGIYNPLGYSPNRLVYNRMSEALVEAKGLPEWLG